MGFISTGGWDNNRVPFVIDAALTANEQTVIQAGIQLWNGAQMFVRLEQRQPGDRDFVQFVRGARCESPVGRQGLRQAISCDVRPPPVGPGFNAVNITHEIGHAVGLLHEHQRPDRDEFIQVVINNDFDNVAIIPDLEAPPERFAGRVGDYDCNSIMHYPMVGAAATFALLPTPPPPPPGTPPPPQPCLTIGGATGLSPGDIEAIRALYDPAGRKEMLYTARGSHLFNRGEARRKALKRRRRNRNALRAQIDTMAGLGPLRGTYENPLFRKRKESGIPFFFGVEYEARGLFVIWHF